jgi:hypothetical protein
MAIYVRQNVEVDMEIGETIVFDLGSTYAHNEIEFGTWRCSWAYYFASPVYMQRYQRHIKPPEPINEWDDQNRLYSLRLTSMTPQATQEVSQDQCNSRPCLVGFK